MDARYKITSRKTFCKVLKRTRYFDMTHIRDFFSFSQTAYDVMIDNIKSDSEEINYRNVLIK